MADLQLSGVAPVVGAGSKTAPTVPTGPAAIAKASSATAAHSAAAASVPAGTPADAPRASGTAPGAPAPNTLAAEVAKAAVKGANAAMAASGTLLVFVFDDQAHHMTVKVLDVQTQKVVQQIPLQHMQATADALAGDSPSGVLVDTKA